MPGYPAGVPRLQSEIDGVLFGSREFFHHADPAFAFRFASGGTLPIIETGDGAYYCFFYRDVFPVGWNIANGASDSLSELLNPMLTIERELREELMFFRLGESPPIDFELIWPGAQGTTPELTHAHVVVERFLADQYSIPAVFKCAPFNARWEPSGPDSIQIRYGISPPFKHRRCYVSINSLDFGIEVDRVARMSLAPGVVVMDGELAGCRPLDRSVGLFEVEKTRASLCHGATEFLPDMLFHTARHILPCPASASELAKDVIQDGYLERLRNIGFRDSDQIELWREAQPKFDLCPVTRQILKRHMKSEAVTSPHGLNRWKGRSGNEISP
jgi:hypothetical protein